ncbi:MAG: hypothetical protein JSW58_03325 [Candidatus Latescibacterota bacterium]|nr:MAG: hypothetical protein JSW58_03325 [Candidatus Latescibacterota bacterium]
MDNFMETLVWVALVGGTATVLLLELPHLVIWCLKLVEKLQKIRYEKARLSAGEPHADEQVAGSEKGASRN